MKLYHLVFLPLGRFAGAYTVVRSTDGNTFVYVSLTDYKGRDYHSPLLGSLREWRGFAENHLMFPVAVERDY